MMLSVSPNCIVRSSLENMLESLQRRDEKEMPWDVPPALPLRAVSRSRPPSAKRRLPVSSGAEEIGERSRFCAMKGERIGQNEIGAREDFEQVRRGEVQNRQHLPELNTAVVAFQSYVRGEIARKQYSAHLRSKKQDIGENLGFVVEELQKRVSMLEAKLELKEEENASLRKQVEQYKAGWLEFEAKTKSNEESWQNQIASLQMDLAAAQKGAVDETEKAAAFNGGSNGVKELKAAFEEERQASMVEVENSHHAYASRVQKFGGLKRMIKAWTKHYKVRVRDSDTKMHSACHSEVADVHWGTWWGKKSKRH